MQTIHQELNVRFQYDVHFTEGVFDVENNLLAEILERSDDPFPRRVLTVIDDGLLDHYPMLLKSILRYLNEHPTLESAGAPITIPGGEAAKNDPAASEKIQNAIYENGVCRHSYVLAVGGGSVLDVAGYAAATAHRGIRLIRVPTTVLSQNDSAVGVKNGINAFGTKNFLGTFAPPYAVINDGSFLESLEDRDWRAGIAEAVKVALIKDPLFFRHLEESAQNLAPPVRSREAMESLIFRCAQLHMEHISRAGDPFEMGSSRPLDFGHWAAHQLEQLTNFELRHGEAVAIGIVLDSTYSHLHGMLEKRDWLRILHLFTSLGFDLFVPELEQHLDEPDHPTSIFQGLETFREHLGGELTIMLLEGIGKGVEVHEVDFTVYREAVAKLRAARAVAENA